MTQDKSPKSSAKKTGDNPPPQLPQPTSGWIDSIARIWMRYSRFGWDVLGILCIAFAVLTIFGVFAWTQGTLISPWINFITRWFGWGSLAVAVAMVFLGLLALRRRPTSEPNNKFPLISILELEGMAFCLLGFLAVLGGTSLPRSEAGLDGGLIGWGLAQLVEFIMPPPFSGLFFVILGGLLAYTGFGLNRWVNHRINGWIQNSLAATDPISNVGLQEAGLSEGKAALGSEDAIEKPYPDVQVRRDERLPPLNLLSQEQNAVLDEAQIHSTAAQIETTLAEFGVPARVVGFRVGPTVTQFAVEPGFVEKEGPDGQMIRQKVRVSQISSLARDLTLALSAERLRIEAPVPGQSFVGIEVPNPQSSVVRLRPILESVEFSKLHSPLAMALGKDVSGRVVVADLGRMPHLLIAGTTGSGKSVCIQAITACLAMNNTPDDLRMAMLDPKMVELVRFNGLPHLLGKVETEIDRMLGVLRWALTEMDNRYRLLEVNRARDLETFNRKMQRRKQPTLPRIVLLIDELADLMMTAPDQTERSVVRLAQMARATGIHLVVATQRPSTDIITGLIKANFPARLSFTVASSIDSRVILDSNGAETLLGRGDMMFLNPESGTPQRAQGVLVNDQEIEKVINFWQRMTPVDKKNEAPWEELLAADENDGDEMVEQAIKIVRTSQRASASMLQRRLRIGYPRAARLIDELEALGVVGPSQGGGRERDVLLPPDEDEESNDNTKEELDESDDAA